MCSAVVLHSHGRKRKRCNIICNLFQLEIAVTINVIQVIQHVVGIKQHKPWPSPIVINFEACNVFVSVSNFSSGGCIIFGEHFSQPQRMIYFNYITVCFTIFTCTYCIIRYIVVIIFD